MKQAAIEIPQGYGIAHIGDKYYILQPAGATGNTCQTIIGWMDRGVSYASVPLGSFQEAIHWIGHLERIKNNTPGKRKKRREAGLPVRNIIGRETKDIVFKQSNYHCIACGRYDASGATLSVDHIIPISKGGSNAMENMQCLCNKCNFLKASKTQDEFRKWYRQKHGPLWIDGNKKGA